MRRERERGVEGGRTERDGRRGAKFEKKEDRDTLPVSRPLLEGVQIGYAL